MKQKKSKFGIFIGRFQPFHLGHLSDVKKILTKVKFLILCIGSAQEKHTEKNPLSAAERKRIIKCALGAEKIPKNRHRIITLNDFGNHNLWVEELIKKLSRIRLDKKYNKNNKNKNKMNNSNHVNNTNTIIFAGNEHSGHFTLYLLAKKRYKVVRMNLLKGISGTRIRQLIRENKKDKKNKEWQHLVPESVVKEIARIYRWQ